MAEDTRTTGKLLRHFGVETPLKAFHQHNEHRALEGVVDQPRGWRLPFVLMREPRG